MINFRTPIIYFSFASILIFSCKGFKQDITFEKSPVQFFQSVDSIVVSKMNTSNIPGLAIGLVANNRILYKKGYGVKNIETLEPVTDHSVFHTASVSKLFTAQGILLLVEEGKLVLDEKLTSIIPELQYKDEAVEQITIMQLLNHTSGLPDISNYHWENNNQSEQALENYILELELHLEHQPSSTYLYSNLGYDILGYIIERKTRTSFETFLKENILNESEMTSSDFRYFKISDSLKVSPHSRNFLTKNPYVSATYPYTREHAPSSTLNASVTDLSRWMISFMNRSSQTQADNVYASMLKPSFEDYPYIGLGFQLYEIDSKTAVGHYGGDKGFRSYLLMVPEENIGLVLLANCDYEEDFRQEILHTITKLMLSQTFTAP